MSNLVSALDSMTQKQNGENEHPEYSWSKNIEEKILQLSFQLIRTNDVVQQRKIGEIYYDMLKQLFLDKSVEDIEVYNPSFVQGEEMSPLKYISILYRLMLQTRDIIKGKGEYRLFYILLGEWVRLSHVFNDNKDISMIINNLLNVALESCISLDLNGKKEHGYGSWKDIKYFLNYIKYELGFKQKEVEELSVFKYAINMMTKQLNIDVDLYNGNGGNISLLGRWIPRERSKKFGWITKHIAIKFYSKWIVDIKTDKDKHIRSVRKALTHYRKTVSLLNKHLDTVQIKQCDKNWSEIDFNKGVSSITLSKQKSAFNYTDKKGNQRGHDEDRIKCRENYKQYIKDCSSGKCEIKGSRCGLVDLVKDAIIQSDRTPQYKDSSLMDTINLQWKNLGKQIGDLGNMIAMVDTSGSMTMDNSQPLHAAIGLGCRIAEKSKLGKRVMTFSKSPDWVNLELCDKLTDMVYEVKKSNWGMTTNFKAAMKLILDACIKHDLTPDEVKDIVLVVFSDMQIDKSDNSCNGSKNKDTMNKMIQNMFSDGGIKSKYKTPYDVPHILFWNLRSTDGFPAISTENNISMLSGFNGSLLNTFCEKGMDALSKCTPKSILLEQLDDDRYKWVDEIIMNEFIITLVPNTSELNEHNSSELDTSYKPETEVEQPETTTGWFGMW